MSLFRLSANCVLKTILSDLKLANTNGIVHLKKCSTVQYSYDTDPAPLFFNKDVQSLLKSLTRIDLEKVYRRRKLGESKLEQPVYKFMTDEQLNAAFKEAEAKAEELLQMPPIVQERVAINEVLSEDAELQGLDTARFVFTDITFGKKDSERVVIVREPDGCLKKADWDIRDRMNQVYFPIKGRELHTPKMFEEDKLKALLQQKQYEFLLDRACLQFEPQDPQYQKITKKVYLHINDNDGFDSLRSTRHFGPLTYFLAWFKIVDNLLLELIETARIDEAKLLIELFGKIHKVQFDYKSPTLIEDFIKAHANKRAPLELALQAYREVEKDRQKLEAGIKKAHGQI